MLLNGMFAFRKTIVQIKRNPDTSTESIADQQPSTYPQHLYKYVSLTTAVQISRLFDILMSHRLYFPRYTELNDPLEGAAIDIPVGGYAGSSIYKQEDREDPFIGGLKAQYRILSLSDALPNYGRIMQGIIPAHAYALGQMGNLVPQKRSSISKGNPNRKPRQWKISLNPQ